MAQSGQQDSTLAKRSVTSTGAATRSGPTPAAARPSASSSSSTHSSYADDSDSDEESSLLSDADPDLSIESYMRRHPCVLDRGSAFLDRHPWIYQLAVVGATGLGVGVETMMLLQLQYSRTQIGLVYCFVVLDLLLFALACFTPPGKPPRCPDEQSVIHLLHGWPASSHHYGLHASEWSRSWSFCHACSNWRPARSHHCTRCGQCVLMMDHHCVWVGQCVGANNLRRFAGYCASITMLSLHSLWVCWQYVQATPFPSSSSAAAAAGMPGGGFNFLWFGLLLVLALGGFSAGAYLSLRVLFIGLRNETHIESIKKHQFEEEARRAKIQSRRSMMDQPSATQQQPQQQTNKKTDAVQRSTAAASASFSASASASASAVAARSSDLESGSALLSSPSATHLGALYFSPFQCACHLASFRVLYCQSFNYPALRASTEPIPPLPFYFDYSTGASGGSGSGSTDWGMNAYLFLEDLRRMEKLHQWVIQGSKPIRERGTDRHMRVQGQILHEQQSDQTETNDAGAQQNGIPSQLRVLGQ